MTRDPAAFPADLSDRVVVHVGRAGDDSVGGQAEVGVRTELECSCEVVTGGNEDFPTADSAEDSTTVNGLLNGLSVLGEAVAFGSIVADVQGKIGGFKWRLGIGFGFRERGREGEAVKRRKSGCCEEGGFQEAAAGIIHGRNLSVICAAK